MEESKLMKRFKKAGLIGCLDGTGITSENYKEFINQPERSKREDSVLNNIPEYGSQSSLNFDEWQRRCGTLNTAVMS